MDTPEIKVRQRWHVKVRGSTKLRTVIVMDVTDKTVMIVDSFGLQRRSERYMREDVNFIERTP